MDLECSLREIPSPSVDLNFTRNLLVDELKILGIVLTQEIKKWLSDASDKGDE
jgi:hypothetical protein